MGGYSESDGFSLAYFLPLALLRKGKNHVPSGAGANVNLAVPVHAKYLCGYSVFFDHGVEIVNWWGVHRT